MSIEDEASVLGKSKRVSKAQGNAQELMMVNHIPSFQYLVCIEICIDLYRNTMHV